MQARVVNNQSGGSKGDLAKAASCLLSVFVAGESLVATFVAAKHCANANGSHSPVMVVDLVAGDGAAVASPSDRACAELLAVLGLRSFDDQGKPVGATKGGCPFSKEELALLSSKEGKRSLLVRSAGGEVSLMLTARTDEDAQRLVDALAETFEAGGGGGSEGDHLEEYTISVGQKEKVHLRFAEGGVRL